MAFRHCVGVIVRCTTQLQREGRIFKRLHHPVDTQHSTAKDNRGGFKGCAKQGIPMWWYP